MIGRRAVRAVRAGRGVRAAVVALGACVAAVLAGAVPAAATPGPSSAPEYWFDTWHIDQLWDAGARGQGVTIAEIDTGVNATLPELRGRILAGKDFGRPGDGRVDRDTDQFGHGTAMASIMVGRPGLLGITGIAPGARVLPIAVPLTRTTDAGQDDHLAAAITWAADHGAKIINMSLGGTRTPEANPSACPDAEQKAIFHAISKGAVLLAAAGNQGPSNNAVEEPGVCLGVVAVGAVNSAGKVASFSSRHSYLTLTAPGVNIPSLSRVAGQAYSGNGTSQATAIASAVMALVWSKHPTLTASQVVARVLATLDARRDTPSSAYGYGILNAQRAVTANVPASAPDPVYAEAAPFAARQRALASAASPKPPKAAAASGATGTYRVGNGPQTFTGKVLTGIAVAAFGLLALLALLAVAIVARRRRARTPEPPPSGAAVVLVDETGLEWHEILGSQPPGPS